MSKALPRTALLDANGHRRGDRVNYHVHAVHDTQGRLSMLATYTQRDGVVTPCAAAERYVMMALPGCKIDRIGGARIGNFDCFSATNPSYPDQPHLVIVTTTES